MTGADGTDDPEPFETRSWRGGPDDFSDGWLASSPHIRVMEEIARGGMGTIHRGRDERIGRDVAVKLLRPPAGGLAEVRRRFVVEARITGQLQHPGVAPIYELGRLDDGRPFIAMKLVRGRTLASMLAERAGPASDLRAFLGVFLHVCQTVAYAHSRRVVHRDLKPANIMVGTFGEVHVMDWGLAKVLDGDGEEPVSTVPRPTAWGDSLSGTILGTPDYMSPEQAAGDVAQVDERSDVFGLGAILYEILTSRCPFPARSPDLTLVSVRESDPEPPRSLSAGVPRDLETLCLKCLEKDPADRYPDAAAVADDLERYISGRPLTARPVGVVGRLRLWCRRNALVTALLGSLAVLLLSVGTGGTFIAISQAKLRLRAEREAERVRMERDFARDQFATTVSILEEYSGAAEAGKPVQLSDRFHKTRIDLLRSYLTRHDLTGEPPLHVLNSMFNLGRLLSIYGPQSESKHWYGEAARMSRTLLAGADGPPDGTLMLARHLVSSHLGLGASLAKERHYDEAIELFHTGRAVAAEYQPRFPSDRRLWDDRYALLGNLALVLKIKGQLLEAAEVQAERDRVLAKAPPYSK